MFFCDYTNEKYEIKINAAVFQIKLIRENADLH